MTPVHLRSQWWAVPIDKNAINIKLHRPLNKYWHVNWEYPAGHQYSSSGFVIWYKTFGGKRKYPDDLQILCTLKECTRWQASEIVESEGNLYYDYILVKGHLQNYTEDPLYSLRSLIKSKGLDTESNILIMQNAEKGDTALQSWNQKEGV